MQIVRFPHPALRFESVPVREINAGLRAIVRRMFDLMYEANGIGLAANQVGLPLRLFIINPTGDRDVGDQEFVFINPQILKRNGSEAAEEGCLSLPSIYGDVRRAERISVEAFDLKGRSFRLDLEELHARVVQHEYDHIDGVIFPDRMTDDDRSEITEQLAAMETVFREAQTSGELPSDEELLAEIQAMADGKHALPTV
ncbi:peptide deformylase [Stratiformator vulcanicus]|uniref:Peptide deformylase n=1 Tax=Stratiformator vulcanicus TaxID=2527980 RepID=A0A517QZG6_9PLAN|nr:peptide deformylase [Stratiformator vulcanicus]QDT36940.1 Peptide deformylase [Stratiformator vulcanicus]